MSKTTLLIITVLVVLAFASGYNFFFQPFSSLPTAQITPAPAPFPTVSPAQAKLEQLSERERVLMLIAAPVEVTTATKTTDLQWVQENKPGSVVLFGSRVSTQAAESFIQGLKSDSYQPWITIDHEGGSVQRLSGSGFTVLPSWSSLCTLPAEERQALLASSSAELKQTGIDFVFGPVVDVASRSAVLGSRTCSGEYETVTHNAMEYIAAFTRTGITSVIKHFPGIGAGRRDLHFQYDEVTVTAADALVYRLILDQYPQIGVMVTHVGVKNQFSELPCSLSSTCVGELSQQFPHTLIFSDALEMVAAGHQEGVTELLTLPQRAVAAIAAGNHILVFGQKALPSDLTEVVESLQKQYTEDETFRQKVDQAVLAILERRLAAKK